MTTGGNDVPNCIRNDPHDVCDCSCSRRRRRRRHHNPSPLRNFTNRRSNRCVRASPTSRWSGSRRRSPPRPPTSARAPLVLNRAILDLTQRVNVMRGVRDVYEYLRASGAGRGSDEHPRRRAQRCRRHAAPEERDALALGLARVGAAERSDERPASRLSPLGHRVAGGAAVPELQADRADFDRAIDEQAARVERARSRLTAVSARHEHARSHRRRHQDAHGPESRERRARRDTQTPVSKTPVDPLNPNDLTPQELEQRQRHRLGRHDRRAAACRGGYQPRNGGFSARSHSAGAARSASARACARSGRRRSIRLTSTR